MPNVTPDGTMPNSTPDETVSNLTPDETVPNLTLDGAMPNLTPERAEFLPLPFLKGEGGGEGSLLQRVNLPGSNLPS